tara:strand:+ start:2265 stop:2435 length:171 start_codon:yes stop_codon:yes gene_type:complete
MGMVIVFIYRSLRSLAWQWLSFSFGGASSEAASGCLTYETDEIVRSSVAISNVTEC